MSEITANGKPIETKLGALIDELQAVRRQPLPHLLILRRGLTFDHERGFTRID